jgi:hypothetical protein
VIRSVVLLLRRPSDAASSSAVSAGLLHRASWTRRPGTLVECRSMNHETYLLNRTGPLRLRVPMQFPLDSTVDHFAARQRTARPSIGLHTHGIGEASRHGGSPDSDGRYAQARPSRQQTTDRPP